MNNGTLRLFNPDVESVQVVEADGHRAYGTAVEMDLYRRTVALVRINDVDCYVVDVFRVRGGKVHDYMLHMRGRFAHVSAREDGGSWAYLVDGDLLETDNYKISANTSYSGELIKNYRVEAGDPFDAFVTDVPLPTDGSLAGHTLLVDECGVLVQAFQIDYIQVCASETLIHTNDEPGMTITPNLVKLEYFPCWGIVGKAKFRIAGSALVRGERLTGAQNE